jgi:hypothetical protein
MIVQCLEIQANLHSSCTVGAKSMDRKFRSAVESIASNCRGVAQPGSAPALGARLSTPTTTRSTSNYQQFQQIGESAFRSKLTSNL